jgi:hypothetical protein
VRDIAADEPQQVSMLVELGVGETRTIDFPVRLLDDLEPESELR